MVGTCERGDFDEDLDVDCSDRAEFKDRWTEVGEPAAIGICGEAGSAPGDGFEPIPALPGLWLVGLSLALVATAGIALRFRQESLPPGD